MVALDPTTTGLTGTAPNAHQYPLDNARVADLGRYIQQLAEDLAGVAIGDTGWVDVTAAAVTATGAAFTTTSCRYRVKNGTAHISWAGTSVNAVAAGDIANLTIMATVPTGIPSPVTVNASGGPGSTGVVATYVITTTRALQLVAVATAISAAGVLSAYITYPI